jgi:hypothetical protein
MFTALPVSAPKTPADEEPIPAGARAEIGDYLLPVPETEAVHKGGDAPRHQVGWFRRRNGLRRGHQEPLSAVGEDCPGRGSVASTSSEP